MIIYKVTNNVNHKCYIGQTIQKLNNRIRSHKYGSKSNNPMIISRAIHKHGWDNFSWEIICECKTKEELDEMEFHYIKQYHSHVSEYGYNLSVGGHGPVGIKQTDERRKHQSDIMTGKGNSMYGKKHSKETRELISSIISKIQKGKNNPNYGNTGNKNPLSKQYEITFPDNHIEIITGMKQFCRDHNINPTSMARIYKGKSKSGLHKGFSCKEM